MSQSLKAMRQSCKLLMYYVDSTTLCLKTQHPILTVTLSNVNRFSTPRSMECRRGLAMRILSVRPSVRPSVCSSVTRVNCDKTEKKSVHAIRNMFSIVFCEKERLVGATLNVDQPATVEAKSPILNR